MKLACAVYALLFVLLSSPAYAGARSIVDMRGKEVLLPEAINRVATISDGFVEEVMTHLGQADKIVALGSWGPKLKSKYTFDCGEGRRLIFEGASPMRIVNPFLDEQICFSSRMSDVLDFEALANASPDLLIMRVGDCTIRAGDKVRLEKTINTIDSLNIPLVVLFAPEAVHSGNLASLREEACIIGRIFGQEEKAANFADSLAALEQLILNRTRGIADKNKLKVLIIGLSADVRKKGGAGQVWGLDTPESYIIENVVGAKNAFRSAGSAIPLSVEQIYALDPDVIILPTSRGYHPPSELLESSYFENLQELRAIKENRVYALPYSPKNCARRAEYPLDMLICAKAVYPELFADINIYEFALEFYQKAYGIGVMKAREVRSYQLLDWMREVNF